MARAPRSGTVVRTRRSGPQCAVFASMFSPRMTRCHESNEHVLASRPDVQDRGLPPSACSIQTDPTRRRPMRAAIAAFCTSSSRPSARGSVDIPRYATTFTDPPDLGERFRSCFERAICSQYGTANHLTEQARTWAHDDAGRLDGGDAAESRRGAHGLIHCGTRAVGQPDLSPFDAQGRRQPRSAPVPAVERKRPTPLGRSSSPDTRPDCRLGACQRSRRCRFVRVQRALLVMLRTMLWACANQRLLSAHVASS
jgi:hypothetical protein